MKNSNTSFPLKIAIGMEQIGSGIQKYTRLHPLELNGFVAPMYGPGFCQVHRKICFRIPLGSRPPACQFRHDLKKIPLIWTQKIKRSVFDWCDHLGDIFAHSIGLEDVIAHNKALTEFTQKALNGSNQTISQVNSETSMKRRKTVLQNRFALNILTAPQGGTCTIR